MNDFQESLRELMQEKNLNRLQLSKLLGISSTAVNGYYNCNSFPSLKTAILMCEIFSCSLDYLFGMTDIRKSEYTVELNTALDNFNENLDTLIKTNKLSISKTMKDIELDEYTYFHWKHGKNPKTNNIVSIAKYFGVSIDWLLGHENKKTPL